MNLKNNNHSIYTPDSSDLKKALNRTTHIGIGAHQDDLEIMAAHGISKCYKNKSNWFTGVTATDGRGSAREGKYKNISDIEMAQIRMKEQNCAAKYANYSTMIQLGYTSNSIKGTYNQDFIQDLKQILIESKPEIIYTHNLTDKHKTHVAVSISLIKALREISDQYKPKHIFGSEVWRDLDWLSDKDKIPLNLTGQEKLIKNLLSFYKSQIAGGKRYDVATVARMKANATYFESHGVDKCTLLWYAMDLTPLIHNPNIEISQFIDMFLNNFINDVKSNLKGF